MQRSMRDFNRDHADRFREARLLVRNEFTGLDGHAQYFNAFSRLLKLDPLGRVPMLGTDQRDLFVPVLRRAIVERCFGRPAQVLDVGCGDGTTFSLFSDVIPPGSAIDAFDPNPAYVEQFKARIGADRRLQLRLCATGAFGDEGLGLAEAYDLITAIHVIYFFEDLRGALVEIYRRLAPGGLAFVVFADELEAYTGRCLHAWLQHRGERDAWHREAEACQARLDMFAEAPAGPSALEALLDAACPGSTVRVEARRQPSRLYGHSLADMLAFANLTGLVDHEDVAKFDVAADLLETAPETVGFRIEDEPGQVRYGMFSVTQPQVAVLIRKLAGD
jgi:SAM-dependent methyltransferase